MANLFSNSHFVSALLRLKGLFFKAIFYNLVLDQVCNLKKVFFMFCCFWVFRWKIKDFLGALGALAVKFLSFSGVTSIILCFMQGAVPPLQNRGGWSCE